jgi:hypothetical protein
VRERHLLALVVVLVVIGTAMFVYKTRVLGFPVLPDTASELWTVEAHVSFLRATPGPAKVRLTIPDDLLGYGRLTENFVSRGFGVSMKEADGRREALWAIRRATGRQSVYYRMTVFRDPVADPDRAAPPFPEVPQLHEPYASAMADIVDEVRDQSADVETFTGTLLNRMRMGAADDNISLFLEQTTSPLERAELARTLLAGARIPARVLQVLPLKNERRRMALQPWLAVHNGDSWLYFDPASGEQSWRRNLIVWSWDATPVLDVSGGLGETIEFWVDRNIRSAISVAKRRAESHGSRIVEFSLLDLPAQIQSVYGVLIMIPIGALVIVLMRNVVGVRTFGTFLPVLVALAFRETKLLVGVILFSLLVGIGLAVRFYLEKLHLLLVPRLAAVLTIVVLMMASLSILSHRLGLETGLSVALFPMVILTMVIERMSVVWEERGAPDALREGFGTLFTAALSYGVMRVDVIEHLAFVYPETLLIVLAIILLLGRYMGYRLTDLRRFRALTGDRP